MRTRRSENTKKGFIFALMSHAGADVTAIVPALKKKRRSPMPHKPCAQSLEQVRQLAIAGLSQEQVAAQIGIDPKTLRKHYGETLSDALAIVSGKIAMSLAQKAINGDVISAIFWLKARAGWRDRGADVRTDDATYEAKQRLLDRLT